MQASRDSEMTNCPNEGQVVGQVEGEKNPDGTELSLKEMLKRVLTAPGGFGFWFEAKQVASQIKSRWGHDVGLKLISSCLDRIASDGEDAIRSRVLDGRREWRAFMREAPPEIDEAKILGVLSNAAGWISTRELLSTVLVRYPSFSISFDTLQSTLGEMHKRGSIKRHILFGSDDPRLTGR